MKVSVNISLLYLNFLLSKCVLLYTFINSIYDIKYIFQKTACVIAFKTNCLDEAPRMKGGGNIHWTGSLKVLRLLKGGIKEDENGMG